MEYFIFKNLDSRDIQGLIVTELPPITKPKMRVRVGSIDGKDGSDITKLGYESYDKILKIGLTRNYNIDNIISWLNGSGAIQFSNEPDKYYDVNILDSISYEKLGRFKTANIKLNTQPFKYSVTERTKTINVSGVQTTEIRNTGNYISKPTIKFTGSGIINLSINGIQYCVLDMTNDATITLDSEKQEAFNGAVLKNRKMEGKFPVLEVGRNTITWTGTLTQIGITKYSRWI